MPLWVFQVSSVLVLLFVLSTMGCTEGPATLPKMNLSLGYATGTTELETAAITYRLRAPHNEVGETITTLIYFSDGVGNPPVEVMVNRALEGLRPCNVGSLTVEIKVVGEALPRFLRGDANMDGQRDISDAVHLLRYLFGSVSTLQCADAGDANDDGTLNVADAVAVLAHLFNNTGPLPDPMDAPGPDPTPDSLDCKTGL